MVFTQCPSLIGMLDSLYSILTIIFIVSVKIGKIYFYPLTAEAHTYIIATKITARKYSPRTL